MRRYELCDLADCIPHVEIESKPVKATAASTNGTHRRGGLDLIAGVAAWLKKRDPAVSGQGGNNHTYGTCANLVKDFGLSKDQAWPLLVEWNATCSPPWSHEDLRKILDNAAEYATHAEGGKADAKPRSDWMPDSVKAAYAAAMGKSETQEAAPLLPTVTTASDLIVNNPELNKPVIEGLLREKELCNLIAVSKTGKSWMVHYLALCIATGHDWLGRFPVSQGDVLLIDNELHPNTLASRIKRVAEAMGLDIANYGPRLHVQTMRGHLQTLNTLGPYFNGIKPGRYRLIVLDAFYRFIPAGLDENSNSDMCSLYNILDAHAQRLETAIVLIHHTSKGLQSDKAVTDVGSGAGAMSRATDTHLILRPHEVDDAVVVDAAVRSWERLEPFVLRWQFPLWRIDPSLDPADLRKSKRPRKPEAQATDAARPEPMPPALFVGKYVTAEPSDKALIQAKAPATV